MEEREMTSSDPFRSDNQEAQNHRKRTESDMEIEPEESPDDNAVKIERNPSASGDIENYNGRFDRWKIICRLLIPAKAAGSVIGKSGSTIKGLREQYGCSVMIPALEVRGPERIITIKAGNYNLIGKIVSRCAEHLDEFLRRNIPLRLLLPEYGIQNFPQNPIKYCSSNFNTTVQIFNVNCPGSNEKVITIQGNADGKGRTVGCLLEKSDQMHNEFPDQLMEYDPNRFSEDIDYGGFNRFGQKRDNQVQWEHKPPVRLHQANQPHSSNTRDEKSENHDKIFVQNNQQFGKDQLWLKKLVLHTKYLKYIVGKGGTTIEEIRKFSGARIKYGPAQREHRLIAISGNNQQIDTAVYMMQKVISCLEADEADEFKNEMSD